MLNQKLKLKLSQKLSPQQIQLMKLIQLSTQEFEQKLSREIEENPALDNTSTEEKESDEKPTRKKVRRVASKKSTVGDDKNSGAKGEKKEKSSVKKVKKGPSETGESK